MQCHVTMDRFIKGQTVHMCLFYDFTHIATIRMNDNINQRVT